LIGGRLGLLNIRGTGDIDYNPVVISYAIVTVDKGVELYVDQAKLSQEVRAHFEIPGLEIKLKKYNEFYQDLKVHSGSNKVRKELVQV